MSTARKLQKCHCSYAALKLKSGHKQLTCKDTAKWQSNYVGIWRLLIIYFCKPRKWSPWRKMKPPYVKYTLVFIFSWSSLDCKLLLQELVSASLSSRAVCKWALGGSSKWKKPEKYFSYSMIQDFTDSSNMQSTTSNKKGKKGKVTETRCWQHAVSIQ